MDRLLFAAPDGTLQINSVTRDKKLFKFKGAVALPKNDEDLIVCGTVYNTTDINFATLEMPAILNVTGKDLSLRPSSCRTPQLLYSPSTLSFSFHVQLASFPTPSQFFKLRANGDDGDVDINPLNIHGVMQVISKDIKLRSYKCKARAYDREVILSTI